MDGRVGGCMGGNSDFHRGNGSREKGQHSGGKLRGLAVTGRQPNGRGRERWKMRKRERNAGWRTGFWHSFLSPLVPPVITHQFGHGVPSCPGENPQKDTTFYVGVVIQRKHMMRIINLEVDQVLCGCLPLSEHVAESSACTIDKFSCKVAGCPWS